MKIIYNGEQDARLYKKVLGGIIESLLKEDENVIYFDADLSNCIGTARLIQEYDRAINCGIAEANMIGIACGTAAVGFKPIVHTFGPFASRRVYDQIFLSGGYAQNPITVIGITAAFNGGTHMPFEDVALYRAIPGAVICDVTDITMLESFLRTAKDLPGVKYLRVGRKESYPVYAPGTELTIGKGNVLREGTDAAIFATGLMVNEARKAAETLAAEGIHARVINIHTIKPLDEDIILKAARECGKIVTAEEHNIIGGLGEAVCACVAEHCPVPVKRIGVQDTFGHSGPAVDLLKQFGLCADNIASVTRTFVGK